MFYYASDHDIRLVSFVASVRYKIIVCKFIFADVEYWD